MELKEKILQNLRLLSTRKRILLILSFFVLATVLAVFVSRSNEDSRPPRNFKYVKDCRERFRDLNPVQLVAARKNGIEPLDSEKDIRKVSTRLRKVNGNRFYRVARLTHSHPYLVPAAKQLLDDIGRNFRDSLDRKGIPPVRLIVTSILRTRANVRSLRKVNANASSNSTHMYGTTMDIAYRQYGGIRRKADPGIYKTVLAEVLTDLRKKGRCYVMYEVKQPCFHITVRR